MAAIVGFEGSGKGMDAGEARNNQVVTVQTRWTTPGPDVPGMLRSAERPLCGVGTWVRIRRCPLPAPRESSGYCNKGRETREAGVGGLGNRVSVSKKTGSHGGFQSHTDQTGKGGLGRVRPAASVRTVIAEASQGHTRSDGGLGFHGPTPDSRFPSTPSCPTETYCELCESFLMFSESR